MNALRSRAAIMPEQRWLVLVVLTIARVSLGFQFQSIASVTPVLIRELGISYTDAGFLIGLSMLPGIVLAIPGGALGRRFGDKRMVCIGLALMTLGGALASFAESYAVLVAGRLVSGVGGVLLNVLMSKMVTDWFAGREIVLAMAVFVNSFPIGIGLALFTLGWLAEALGWRIALGAAAALALASFVLVAFAYQRHANDGGSVPAATARARISRREVVLVCLAGAIWGIYNGAYSIIVGFAPILLAQNGLTLRAAGFLVGLSTWVVVLSVQIGGIAAQRWRHPSALLVGSVVLWAICLLALPSIEPAVALVTMGLVQGLPVGIIMSLPAEVLRPDSRAAGMGFFYTGLYVGLAGLPPVSGWLQDLAGDAAASLYFAGALVLSIVPIFAVFRLFEGRAARSSLVGSAA